MTGWTAKKQTMQHYDQSAAVYDIQYYNEQKIKLEVALRDLALSKENIVLDAGSGTGLLLPNFAGRVRIVVCLDISALILKQIRKKFKYRIETALIRADADFMPFPSRTFDVVLAVTLLQNMPLPCLTINEIKRVTKNHSTIIITGLRKAFSLEVFKGLLRKAGLEIRSLKDDELLKDYVAICVKNSKKTLKET